MNEPIIRKRLVVGQYAKLYRWWEDNFDRIERLDYSAAAAHATAELGFQVSSWHCCRVGGELGKKLSKVRARKPRGLVGQLNKKVADLDEMIGALQYNVVAIKHRLDLNGLRSVDYSVSPPALASEPSEAT
jgi:hypothetical protein